MTHDPKHEAQAREAWKRQHSVWSFAGLTIDVRAALIKAAELAEAGWTPEDPDVPAVREVLAKAAEARGRHAGAERYRRGEYDNDFQFQDALAAYRAGKADAQGGVK